MSTSINSLTQFIELVRLNSPTVLQYAELELGPFADIKNTDLEDIIALIAYSNPLSSPLGHYFNQERREYVASKLNNYIISCHGGNTWTGFERLVQQSTVVRDVLHEEKEGKNNKVFYMINQDQVSKVEFKRAIVLTI